jgi:hypothetical protein
VVYKASENVENLLKTLASSEAASEDAKKTVIDRSRRAVEGAEERQIHRTPSSLAEQVVEQALRGIGRRLLSREPDYGQTATSTDQPHLGYSPINKHRKGQRSLAERRFIHALIHDI